METKSFKPFKYNELNLSDYYLSPQAKTVFKCLRSLCLSKGYAFIFDKSLIKMLKKHWGLSIKRRQLQRHLHNLENKGLIFRDTKNTDYNERRRTIYCRGIILKGSNKETIEAVADFNLEETKKEFPLFTDIKVKFSGFFPDFFIHEANEMKLHDLMGRFGYKRIMKALKHCKPNQIKFPIAYLKKIMVNAMKRGKAKLKSCAETLMETYQHVQPLGIQPPANPDDYYDWMDEV